MISSNYTLVLLPAGLTENGIQKVYYKSPLAHSLLGQTVGDIVKIGNLDNRLN